MKGRPIVYSQDELAWIEARKEWPRAQLHAEFVSKFSRGDVSLGTLNGLCKRKGWMTGRDGRIGKGDQPWNKGIPYSPPGSEKTRFKKGNLPHNTKWAGHERVSKDGYVEISVEETNPYTGYGRRYVLKHVWLWERANGPIPDGHCLKAKDGNRGNSDPANWELIPRALLPALNGGRHKRRPAYDDAAPEIRPTLLTLAKVEAKVRALRRGKSAA